MIFFLLDKCRYYIDLTNTHEYAGQMLLTSADNVEYVIILSRSLFTCSQVESRPDCVTVHASHCTRELYQWNTSEYLYIHYGMAAPTPALRNALIKTSLFRNLPSFSIHRPVRLFFFSGTPLAVFYFSVRTARYVCIDPEFDSINKCLGDSIFFRNFMTRKKIVQGEFQRKL